MEKEQKDTNNNVACCILSSLRNWSVLSMHLFFLLIYTYIYINIMRGKKDGTTFPDKPVSWIASLFRGLTNCRQYCFGLLGLISAVPHPSRVLNLDMKAKLCVPKSYITIYNINIYIYIYIYIYTRKKYRLRKAQILYTLVVNISPVKASSVQSYGN